MFFRKGDKIIQQGAQDIDVYFLLSGEVDIVFKSQIGSIREAPNQIGEMAALEPGKKRTASVIARSNEVAALRVPGTVFREIWSTNPRFQQFLQFEMSTRHRERIATGKIAKESYSIKWFVLSMGAGLIAGLATCYLLVPSDWTPSARSVLSFAAGLIIFVFILLHNPIYFWRRSFWLVLLAMLGTLVLDWFVSIEVTGDLRSLQFGVNVGDAQTDWTMYLIKAVPFLIVLGLCAYMDNLNTSD